MRIRKLKLTTAATAAALTAIGIFLLVVSIAESLQFTGWEWTVFALSSFVVFVPGWRFHSGAWQSARMLSVNMNTLVSIGTLAAWGWSVSALFRDGDLYFETAAVIVLLILLGRWMEQRSLENTRSTIARLTEMMPKQVMLESGEQIPIAGLKQGMNFRAREGEFIAADGEIVSGEAALDTSMLTGEPLNQQVFSGDKVIGSTVVTRGDLVVRATRTGDATFHSYILRLIEDAQASALPAQKLVDKVSGFFTFAVIGIAAATLAIWLAVGGLGFEGLGAAVSVLIIACPCALGLAAPIAITTATGRAAQQGILLKNTNVLEAVKNIDIAAFDKTGTLTAGKIQIEEVVLSENGGGGGGGSGNGSRGGDESEVGSGSENAKEELLEIALALESRSIHPIAIAITSALSNGRSGDRNEDENHFRGGHEKNSNLRCAGAGVETRVSAEDADADVETGVSAGARIGAEKTENGRNGTAGAEQEAGWEAKRADGTNWEVANFRTHPGLGVSGEIRIEASKNRTAEKGGVVGDGEMSESRGEIHKAAIGKAELFEHIAANLRNAEQDAAAKGKIAVYCGSDKKARGLIILSDTLREEAVGVMAELRARNIKTVMITGDSKSAAQKTADGLGFEEIHAEVLPDQKVSLIRQLQGIPPDTGRKNQTDKNRGGEKSRVLMVGDGTNDAAALTAADLAIAVGTGTEAALESADIALTGRDLRGVVDALDLSQKTRRVIVSNLFWAFFYNAAAIPLAAVGLLNPIIAAAAMSFSSLFVVLNSARLARFKGRHQNSFQLP